MIVDKVVTTGPAFKVPSHLSFAQYAIDKLKDICNDKNYKDGVSVVRKTIFNTLIIFKLKISRALHSVQDFLISSLIKYILL